MPHKQQGLIYSQADFALSLLSTYYFPMGDSEPAIFRLAPFLPCFRYPLQIFLGAMSTLDDGILDITRGKHPLGPDVTPPLPLRRLAEAPGPRGAGDGFARKPGFLGPDVQVRSRVGVAAHPPRDPAVDVVPRVQALETRIPGHAGRLAHGHDAAGLGDAAHLAEGADRVRHVLQHLVGMHDVEGIVGILVQIEHIAHGERRVGDALFLRQRAGRRQRLVRVVDPDDVAVRHVPGEVERDGARSAADVEDGHVPLEVGQEVGGRVCGRSPLMRAQRGRVVIGGVDRGWFWQFLRRHIYYFYYAYLLPLLC